VLILIPRNDVQAEEAKKAGTPVTAETFAKWKRRFVAETRAAAKEAEEARLRALAPREREEARKWANKPSGAPSKLPLSWSLLIDLPFTGRQLFERSHDLDSSDAAYVEEGDVAVDASQYERARSMDEEDEDADRLVLSDSD
jgi:hypothetical protein